MLLVQGSFFLLNIWGVFVGQCNKLYDTVFLRTIYKIFSFVLGNRTIMSVIVGLCHAFVQMLCLFFNITVWMSLLYFSQDHFKVKIWFAETVSKFNISLVFTMTVKRYCVFNYCFINIFDFRIQICEIMVHNTGS